MADKTKIEWADATWSPLLGCSPVSSGCAHCYAIRTAWRMSQNPNPKIAAAYAGLVEIQANGVFGWTGKVNCIPERLDIPLRWKTPRRIFVNSQSDLFHEAVSNEFIAAIFGIMAVCPQHTFQILTKRPQRMVEWFRWLFNATNGYDHEREELFVQRAAHRIVGSAFPMHKAKGTFKCYPWPLQNVWLGISAENQATYNQREPLLRDTPAAVRFISFEPLLGAIDAQLSERVPKLCFRPWCGIDGHECLDCARCGYQRRAMSIDWAICGGESGPNARPMHPDWAKGLRDQCTAVGVPLLMKQWGEWAPAPWRVERQDQESDKEYMARSEATCATHSISPWGHVHKPTHAPWSGERTGLPQGVAAIRRVGKHNAGRLLDGVLHDAYPTTDRPGTPDPSEPSPSASSAVQELAAP